jgi:hypothetical protein
MDQATYLEIQLRDPLETVAATVLKERCGVAK